MHPGKPQQNAHIERYNRTVRYDWLNQHLFRTIERIREHATRWLWACNHERPDLALGGINPKQELAGLYFCGAPKMGGLASVLGVKCRGYPEKSRSPGSLITKMRDLNLPISRTSLVPLPFLLTGIVVKPKMLSLHVHVILAVASVVGLSSLSTDGLSSERGVFSVTQPSGGPYVLTRSSIDSGGGRSMADSYELQGTLGQPDASVRMTAAGFELYPGFQVPASVDGGSPIPSLIFQDRFESD